jgi:arylsulfatase
MHAWPEDIAKYRGKYMKGWDAVRRERYERMIEMGLVDKDWTLSDQDSMAWDDVPEEEKDTLDYRMAIYAAMVDRLDQNVGRLITRLKELGEWENTLILFFADNGGCSEPHSQPFGSGPKEQLGTREGYFLTYGRSWANVSNTPFRYYKHWTHEGGIASPFIAHWPNGIKARGEFRTEPAHLIDLMPTFLELAGARYPSRVGEHTIPPMEGTSLVPAFAGEALNREAIYFEHEGNRAVRMGRWKLVAAHEEEWKLHDMELDRTETHDVSEENEELYARMIAMYGIWAERCGVEPWPVLRSEGYTPAKRSYPKTLGY